MAKSIKPGTHTIASIFKLANFDFETKASADYLDGSPDARRVTVGNLPFDSLDDVISVPVTAEYVEVLLDGKVAAKLSVKLNEREREERASSFELAADVN